MNRLTESIPVSISHYKNYLSSSSIGLEQSTSIFPSTTINYTSVDRIPHKKLSRIDQHIAKYVTELANSISKININKYLSLRKLD